MYSLERKLCISQHADNQRDAEFNVGFVYSLQSFFVSPFIYVYSNVDELCTQPYISQPYGSFVRLNTPT